MHICGTRGRWVNYVWKKNSRVEAEIINAHVITPIIVVCVDAQVLPHFQYQVPRAHELTYNNDIKWSPWRLLSPPAIRLFVQQLFRLTLKIPSSLRFAWAVRYAHIWYKQRVLTPGHQGWNDLHSLCRIGMEYYLLNNNDNNIIYWIMMIIIIMMIMIIMMTMMIIGTIMIMIIIITTTLTMTIMKMIMIKTAQTPCQSLFKDRRI